MSRGGLPLLGLLLALGPGCIIPLGPDWQDPLAAPNTPPSIVASMPQLGTVHVAPATLTIEITDANAGDTLFVRFLADYPPFTSITRPIGDTQQFFPSLEGQPVRHRVEVTPDCETHDLAPSVPTHQIYVVVADRAFRNSLQRPEALADPKGLTDSHVWTLELDCP